MFDETWLEAAIKGVWNWMTADINCESDSAYLVNHYNIMVDELAKVIDEAKREELRHEAAMKEIAEQRMELPKGKKVSCYVVWCKPRDREEYKELGYPTTGRVPIRVYFGNMAGWMAKKFVENNQQEANWGRNTKVLEWSYEIRYQYEILREVAFWSDKTGWHIEKV